MNVVTALEKSANTFFYKTGMELGIKKIAEYSQLVWFWPKKTGVDLPGEKSGWSLKKNLNSRHWVPGRCCQPLHWTGVFFNNAASVGCGLQRHCHRGVDCSAFSS